MSTKMRSVNTRFWDDPWITELTPSEKLLFLYLLTNTQTNIIGIYEITTKRIKFDTGLDDGIVRKGLERFERDRKAFYVDGHVILPNFLKHQNLNSNMKIGAVNEFNKLPKQLTSSILGNDSEPLPNDYQTIRNAMLKYEIEIEIEIQVEGESESLSRSQSKADVIEKITIHYRDLWKQAIAANKPNLCDPLEAIVKAIKEEPFDRIAAMNDHIRITDLEAWLRMVSVRDIIDTMRQMENYKDLKKYKSMRLTLNNWIKKDNK